MKNNKRLTFQESGETIQPLTNFANKSVKCNNHTYEKREDGFGHIFIQCKKFGQLG